MDILSSEVNISCPACSSAVRVRLSDIQRRRTVRCQRGHSIQLREDGDGLRKLDRSTKDLERSLRRLGGTIRFDI